MSAREQEWPLDVKEEFELREKRLGLVYKMLYVIAALWATLFITYLSDINDTAPVFCGVLAILSTTVYNIIFFIFSELRCLKISTTTDTEEREQADSRFRSVWDTIGICSWFAALLVCINLAFPNLFSGAVWSITVITIGTPFAAFLPRKYEKVKPYIKSILICIIAYLLYALMQTATASLST